MVEPRRTGFVPYLLALGVVAAAFATRMALTPVLGNHYGFATFVVGVLFSAWRLGLGPSIMVMALGGFLAVYLFLPPVGEFSLETAEHFTGLILYLFIGSVGIAISTVERRLRSRLEAEVAERRRVEAELRQNQSTLRAFYDHAPICMGIVEPTGDGDVRHLYDNPATCKFFGVERGSTMGRLASEMRADPRVLSTWLAHYERSLTTRAPSHFEHEFDTPEGSRWLSVTVCPLGQDDDPTPHLPRFCYVAEDTTEARSLSRQLEAERSLLDAFFASTTVALGLVDPLFRFLRVNDAMAEADGLSPDEHVGRPVSEVLPGFWPTLEPGFRRVLRDGVPVRGEEILGDIAAGGPGPARSWIVNYHPVRVDGTFLGVGLAIVETTESRRRALQVAEAEERLRRAEDRFRASQDASLFGFMILRAERDGLGRIADFSWEYVNPAATAIIRRRSEELIGNRMLDLFPDARQRGMFQPYVRVAETGVPHDVELTYDHGGSVRWYRNMAIKLGDGVAVSFSDITDRKRAELDLRDADRRKNEFLAMLAHELRNPLAPIRNAIGVLELQEGDVESLRWARSVIDRQIRHLTSLVDDLLDVSRINEGKIKLTRSTMDLATAVAAAVEAAQPTIDARGHQFEWSMPDDPLMIDGDGTRLTQVVLNLLTNAAKYTPQGGKIRLAVERAGETAVVRVSDNGNGIPAEMLPKVFELFVQVERSLDRSEGGLGIGLTLVRRLVEKHGGTVEARSGGPGLGSEFIIRLPLLSRAQAGPSQPGNAHRPAPPTPHLARRAGRQILVVDDSHDSADSLARVLRRMGHHVETAYDGPSGRDLAQSLVPDLIFLDIGLPGMDGFEVARALRQDPALDATQIVALTGYGTTADRRRSADAGFDDHLVKPVEFDSLRNVLDQPHIETPLSG